MSTQLLATPEHVGAATDRRSGVMQVVLSLAPGGTERLVVELATRLAHRFRMPICCLDEAGEWAEDLSRLGIPVTSLQRQPGFHPTLGVRLARVAAAHGATILHCHHYSPFVYGRIAALVSPRLQLVFTEHGRLSDGPPALKRRIANTLVGRSVAPMFAVSAALRTHMLAEGFSADRVAVIHNGIDPGPVAGPAARRRARIALGIAPDTFLVGTAARLDPVKDLAVLVNAVAALRARIPSARLVIVGDGPERGALEAAIREHGALDAMQLIGYRSDVRDLLPAFDVYVNSSISEGVSLTILEAMAASLPVVATSVGGTPEVVVDGVTGILVEPRRPDLIAQALIQLAENPFHARDLGTAGRARLEERFTIDRMIRDYEHAYERLGAR
jgi:glycosyltransferase involved in cell wall biosynthesis